MNFGSYTDACKGVFGGREASIRQYIYRDLRKGLGVGFQVI
jgi:hypothetical protein